MSDITPAQYDEVLASLKTSRAGLSVPEAERRAGGGRNELPGLVQKSALEIIDGAMRDGFRSLR